MINFYLLMNIFSMFIFPFKN